MVFNFIMSKLCNRAFSSTVNKTKSKFIWIDLEMTGLDVTKDTILEVACLITLPDLSIVHNGFHMVVHQNDEVLNSMNDWCKKQHSQSNLITESRSSKTSIKDVEQQLKQYIQTHTHDTDVKYLAGNSVYMDLLFIQKYMSSVAQLLHYRLIDVSTLKTLIQNWYPKQLTSNIQKSGSHRALEDIKESIAELQQYKSLFFK